jgi:N-acetylmuramoyl-L-alanine amidase
MPTRLSLQGNKVGLQPAFWLLIWLVGTLAMVVWLLASHSIEGQASSQPIDRPPPPVPYDYDLPEYIEAPSPTAVATFTPTSVPLKATHTPEPQPLVVVLDPGHGGPDGGAGNGGLAEKNANLAIALRLANLLKEDGYQVVLTRDTDRAVNDPPRDWTGDGQINSRDELQARVDIANSVHAVVFISIHNNGSPSPNESGTEVWWSPDRPFADQNQQLAALVQTGLLKRLAGAGYTSKDRGIKNDHAFRIWNGRPYNIFVLGPASGERHPRATAMPGVLGESLFVSHPFEASLLRQDHILEAIAWGYRDAIVAFLAR